MTLDQLDCGETACVVDVGGDGAFRRRLLELGLLPGTPILRTGQAPFGDPLSFRLRGAVLCLRRVDARSIGIRHPPQPTDLDNK
jgi:ferrous iron transport protein A